MGGSNLFQPWPTTFPSPGSPSFLRLRPSAPTKSHYYICRAPSSAYLAFSWITSYKCPVVSQKRFWTANLALTVVLLDRRSSKCGSQALLTQAAPHPFLQAVRNRFNQSLPNRFNSSLPSLSPQATSSEVDSSKVDLVGSSKCTSGQSSTRHGPQRALPSPPRNFLPLLCSSHLLHTSPRLFPSFCVHDCTYPYGSTSSMAIAVLVARTFVQNDASSSCLFFLLLSTSPIILLTSLGASSPLLLKCATVCYQCATVEKTDGYG